MKEQELIGLLQRRDPSGLEQLQHHYGPLIRYIISPILPDLRDREEVFSDILLRVWDRIDQYDGRQGSWSNWLSVVSRNAAIDQVRKQRASQEMLSDHLSASGDDPEQKLLRKEREKALRNALCTLSNDQRTLFYRKYYYRQSTAQIAAEYGTSERAIEGRLYRIKKKLRNELGGEKDG